MTEEQKRNKRKWLHHKVTRNGAILTFAICAATFEITLGGARPSVLTFLSGVFLSPLIMQFDERKNNNGR